LLGYLQEDWYQEVALGSIRLDFLAFAAQILPFTVDENSPLSLIIEAKNPNYTLDKYVYQLKQYLRKLHATFGLLTNGQEVRIYERFKKDIRIVFRCSGKEVCERIDEIRYIIGKESIQERRLRNRKGSKYSKKSAETSESYFDLS
jgi:hypothetical protein